jgi:polar amino acid transport system permease protein
VSDGEREGLFERLSLASARIPFRAKLAAVWIVIFALLAWLFTLSGFDTQWMRENVRYIAGGIRFTLTLAVAAIILAIIMATLGAICRISSNPILVGVSGFYTSFFRGTPLIVQLFFAYLALPQIARGLVDAGIGGPSLLQAASLNTFQAGVLALGLNYGAYMTEIFRAGIQAVPHGQWEASQALGLRYGQTMRKVVLPQAVRIVIPPTGNEFIAMMKDTALVGILGQALNEMEVFGRASLLGKADFRTFEALVLAAGMYWALTAIFSFFQARLERRVSKGYVRTSAKPTAPKGQPQVVPAAGDVARGDVAQFPAADRIGTTVHDHDALPGVPPRHPGSGRETGPGT